MVDRTLKSSDLTPPPPSSSIVFADFSIDVYFHGRVKYFFRISFNGFSEFQYIWRALFD